MNGNSLICCLCRYVQLIQHTCMNETLFSWTLKFHKAVRQQNSGAVEDFILPYSAVYLRIQKWKNYWKRSTFAKVIVKIKVVPFFVAHGVYVQWSLQCCDCSGDVEHWHVVFDADCQQELLLASVNIPVARAVCRCDTCNKCIILYITCRPTIKYKTLNKSTIKRKTPAIVAELIIILLCMYKTVRERACAARCSQS